MFDSRATWSLRHPDDDESVNDVWDIYDTNPDLFSIKLHYGGSFHLSPLREYKDGNVRHIDCISMDYFNLLDMDVIALGAGYKYKTVVWYLWRLPDVDLDRGLRPLQCDIDVKEFLSHAAYYKFMDVYMDATPLYSLCMLSIRSPSTVVLSEIEPGMESSDDDIVFPRGGESSDESSSDYSSESDESIDDIGVDDGSEAEDSDGNVWDEVELMEPHGDGFVVANVVAPGTPERGEDVAEGSVAEGSVAERSVHARDEPVRDSTETVVMLLNSQTIQGDDVRVDPMMFESSSSINWETVDYDVCSAAFEDLIRVWPDIKIEILQVAINNKYGIMFSDNGCRYTKQKALKKIQGDHLHQFSLLWDYSHELKRSHPGSTVIIDYDERREVTFDQTVIFKRIYICLRPLVEGFKSGCRNLIGLDGCHTKGMYRQQILTAVSLDPNNGWWPVAWAVVEQENMTTWKWFLNFLQQDLNIPNNNSFVFISDKQKGLEGALYELMPGCEHRNCALHLYKNFQKENRGNELRDRFWACCRASHPVMWERQMERMKAVDENAYTWMVEHGGNPKKWSKAFFPLTVKSDMLCNNLSESFNSFILQARDKPIITMLETIRRLCMERIRDRRLAMERKPGPICPRIAKMLDDRYELSQKMVGRWNGGDEFEVEAFGHKFAVNVRTRECTCRIWQLTGIPCAHSIPCILEKGLTPIQYVEDCYSTSAFIKTYEHVLFPTTSAVFWENTNGVPLAPPVCVRLAGRPKKSRRRGADEVQKKGGKYVASRTGKQHCSLCGATEHNKKTCPQRNSASQSDAPVKKTATKKKRKSTTRKSRVIDETLCQPEGDAPAIEEAVPGPSTKKRRKTKTKTKKQQNLELLEELMGNMDVQGKIAVEGLE